MAKWPTSLLAALSACGLNPAQGIFVRIIICLYDYLCVFKNNKLKIHN